METTDYCSYELSKALKAARFDEPCDHYYCAFDNETDIRFWSIHPAQSHNGFTNPDDKVIASAPTLWQAQKWLRENKKIHINIISQFGVKDNKTHQNTGYDVFVLKDGILLNDISRKIYQSYEEALSDGIKIALKSIK